MENESPTRHAFVGKGLSVSVSKETNFAFFISEIRVWSCSSSRIVVYFFLSPCFSPMYSERRDENSNSCSRGINSSKSGSVMKKSWRLNFKSRSFSILTSCWLKLSASKFCSIFSLSRGFFIRERFLSKFSREPN